MERVDHDRGKHSLNGVEIILETFGCKRSIANSILFTNLFAVAGWRPEQNTAVFIDTQQKVPQSGYYGGFIWLLIGQACISSTVLKIGENYWKIKFEKINCTCCLFRRLDGVNASSKWNPVERQAITVLQFE